MRRIEAGDEWKYMGADVLIDREWRGLRLRITRSWLLNFGILADWPYDVFIRIGPFMAHVVQRLFWFRLFGYGLHWKDTRYHPPLYSERVGLRWKFRVKTWAFGFLRPENHRKGKRRAKDHLTILP